MRVNWLKTHSPVQLKRFALDFAGYSFCVMPQSNNDLGKDGYKAAYKERMSSNNQNIITDFLTSAEMNLALYTSV
jgi:hypothetical protein